MGWTNEQQLVIDTRKKNMLVSAAAGSGKTAVLVERIISEVLDEANPIDVDRILVVTFTNAAAAEMKERVRKAIDKAVNDNPKRADIRKQATLIHNAQIRTIDSFCNWVVKNYFYEIDQDPSFRVGSSGELDMLTDEVISDLIGKRFEEHDEDFIKLADAYISGKNVDDLKKKVFEIYNKAMSFPWPMEWYDQALSLYEVGSVEEMAQGAFVKKAIERARVTVESILLDYDKALAIASAEQKYYDFFAKEKLLFENLHDALEFDDIQMIMSGAEFARYPTVKKTDLSEDEKQQLKKYRDNAKAQFGKLYEKYFMQPLSEVYTDLMYVKKQAETFIRFSKDYTLALSLAKKKKNLYDFNDIEHMALEILRNKESKEHEKRPVAIELSNHFEEVMVDEYQDSNDLQEWILTSVSREDNYFTVGDVKQSIYAFRQASPALFMDKFESYVDGRPDSVRIDLDRNFRSRNEVLQFSNDVFKPLMQKDMGNVAYDTAAELKLGATYYPDNGEDDIAEIIVGNYDKETAVAVGISSPIEFEAQIVADKIKSMVKEGFLVTADDPSDREKKILRPVRYNDIVILMRSTKSNAPVFLKRLTASGIPAYVEEETGFFERDEIQTVLSMLEVIDNPYNDIPLAAVLHSAMFGFDSEQLATIRCTDTEATFYECILDYARKHPEDAKMSFFFNLLTDLQDKMIDTPIHNLILEILDKTDFKNYISALPMGEVAVANLNKLMDEAISFEGSSYQGLSAFVGYINDLKTYDEDLGLAKTVSESDAAVRIMTIHKSKGLEFPVVFVSRCCSGFMPNKSSIVYYDKLGLGMNYRNPDTRVSYSTLFSNVIKDEMMADERGEEQRVLYVALTRAKEKLIVTGVYKPTAKEDVAEKLENMRVNNSCLTYAQKEESGCYMDWIIKSLSTCQNAYKRLLISPEDLLINSMEEHTERELTKQSLLGVLENVDKSLADDLNQLHSFVYVNAPETKYKGKYSVSEIKHQAMEDAFGFSEDAKPVFLHNEEEAYIPDFAREDMLEVLDDSVTKVPAGALYGTAMHRFMECYDFARDDYAESFDEQLEYMVKTGSLPDNERRLISISKLKKFMTTPLASRMHNCSAADKLYKEQPFVFGSLPEDIFETEEKGSRDIDSNLNDMVLVQGIIDVFFEESDGIVLLDYKTDRVDDSKELVLRYEKQLRLYESAIESAYQMPVKEILVYSFSLDQTIRI